MTIMEVMPLINLKKPWNLPLTFQLASGSSIDSFKLEMGNIDIFVYGISVELIDGTGKVIADNDTIRTGIKFKMQDNQADQYQTAPYPVFALADIASQNRFQGWLLDKNLTYTFELIGQNLPATVGDYPIYANVTFLGYKLG